MAEKRQLLFLKQERRDFIQNQHLEIALYIYIFIFTIITIYYIQSMLLYTTSLIIKTYIHNIGYIDWIENIVIVVVLRNP